MGLDNPIHIAFLLILLLLVFGAKRLPEMGRSLGSGMRGFKDALSGQEQPSLAAQPPQSVPAVQPAVQEVVPVATSGSPATPVAIRIEDPHLPEAA